MSIKWKFLAGAFILFIAQAQAQKVSIGARGGLSIPNLSAGSGKDVTPLNQGYSSRLAAGFGAFAEFKFSDLFSLQPMIEYSAQGGKKNGYQALTVPDQIAAGMAGAGMTVPDYLYADYKSTAKMNYLQIPILAKFGWNLGKQSPFRVYVDAGPFIGILLNAHQVLAGGSKQVFMNVDGASVPFPNPYDPTGQQPFYMPFDSTVNIKNQLHSTNFGVEGNVGISYKIKKSTLFIEGGGNYGLMNIQKKTSDGKYGNGKNHAGAGTVMLGYAYDLK